MRPLMLSAALVLATSLGAQTEMVGILTPEQIDRYDELRGYK